MASLPWMQWLVVPTPRRPVAVPPRSNSTPACQRTRRAGDVTNSQTRAAAPGSSYSETAIALGVDHDSIALVRGAPGGIEVGDPADDLAEMVIRLAMLDESEGRGILDAGRGEAFGCVERVRADARLLGDAFLRSRWATITGLPTSSSRPATR